MICTFESPVFDAEAEHSVTRTVPITVTVHTVIFFTNDVIGTKRYF